MLVSAGLVALREHVEHAHVALLFLLVVLIGTAEGGRGVGFGLAAGAFLLFNWFFVPPYGTLTVAKPVDWLALVAFLITSVVAAQLLARARSQSENAQRRAEAERLKDALLASVSHDLRTPLTTIKALAHDLRALGDERIETIELEADRLNRFVVDLLDLSRLNAGSLSLRIELNAADDLIGVAMQQTSGILDGRRIDVELDPADPVIFGRFDLVHSVRVLVNLIQNACKYSPAGDTILVAVHREGPWLAFTVSDRGPGIAPAEHDRLFAPFYRPDGVASDSGSAGLGLAIARGLAEAQHGSLKYEPRAGGGSTFIFRVPAAELDEVITQSL